MMIATIPMKNKGLSLLVSFGFVSVTGFIITLADYSVVYFIVEECEDFLICMVKIIQQKTIAMSKNQ